MYMNLCILSADLIRFPAGLVFSHRFCSQLFRLFSHATFSRSHVMSSSSHSILAPIVIEPMQRPSSANNKSKKMDRILPMSATESEPELLVNRAEASELPSRDDAAIGRY